jgi:hypothetical protein
VVDQQQLHHPVLGLLGRRGGVLGLDLHPRGEFHRAGRLRLDVRRAGHRHGAHGAVGPGHRHLDQALPAGGHLVEQRVVAEPGDVDADLLGGPDDQGALGHLDLDAVDGRLDQVGGGAAVQLCGDCHQEWTSAKTVDWL